MTSSINYTSINENFPVAGEDNDTQTFRDNFDTIKTSLQAAYTEITALQDPNTGAAIKGSDNDFNNAAITRAVFQNTMDRKLQGGIIDSNTTKLYIDYENGSYQIFKFSHATPIEFQNLPQNSNPAYPLGVGKMTLELSSDGTTVPLSFITTNGSTIRSKGFPNGQSPSSFTVSSASQSLIIEVWRHSQDVIFMNYVGVFA